MTDIADRFSATWDEVLQNELEDERSRGFTPSQFYASGRASKSNPNKEDPAWWASNGPSFIEQWVTWRDNCGLDIWEPEPGVPAIELPVRATRGDLELFSIVDRVFTDGTDLYLVDLKSGSHTPTWPRQLALNNLGLAQNYGRTAKYGGFWNPRKGGIVGGWSDLRIYEEEWMWEQVRRAREIRDQGLFVAQPTNLCTSSCGVREYCRAVGGALSLFVQDATSTEG